MIYHYCNVDAFHSIIETKQVWLTDITKLNDRTEYKSGFDVISGILKKKGLSDRPELQEITTEKLNSTLLILAGCFSKEGDSGSQWGLYGDDSKGLSIGFDEIEIAQLDMFNGYTNNGFQPITSFVALREVNYDRSDFSSRVSDFIDEMKEKSPILKYKLLAIGLRRLAAIYKDPYFKDEREVRAVLEIEHGSDDLHTLEVRVNAFQEKAIYHKLLTSYEDCSAIKEVIIGANCHLTKEDVARSLHERGLEKVSVRDSSGRGRYRTASK
ncbi:DUF2971 domain-containing protein [Stenotrophomonas maltophilia]